MYNDEKEIFLKFLVPIGFTAGIINGFQFIWAFIYRNPHHDFSLTQLSAIVLLSWGCSGYALFFMKRRFGWFQKKSKDEL